MTYRVDVDSLSGTFLQHYLDFSSDAILLQVAKLHDRPFMGRHSNLSIGFFFGQAAIWSDDDERSKLDRIKTGLERFFKDHIKTSRNKIFAYSDLGSYQIHTPLCTMIPVDEFEKYMCSLGELSAGIWQEWARGMTPPWPSDPHPFDFSPQGKLRERYVSIAEETVDRILVGGYS